MRHGLVSVADQPAGPCQPAQPVLHTAAQQVGPGQHLGRGNEVAAVPAPPLAALLSIGPVALAQCAPDINKIR